MVLKKLAAVAKSRVYIYTYMYILIYSIVFRSAISSRASMYRHGCTYMDEHTG